MEPPTKKQCVDTKINVSRCEDPIGEQRLINGQVFPLVMRCQATDANAKDVADWVATNQDLIEADLRVYGAVLFRGFPLKSAEDFNTAVSAFKGWRDLPYEESLSFAVRKQVTSRICTTNEGKSGGLIFHHEQAASPLVPSKLFFLCEKPAAKGDGGQTGICSSAVVLERLRERFPDFVKDCEAKGVKYISTMSDVQDTSKGVGRSWKSYFHVETREELDKRMKELGYTAEWLPGGLLRATTPKLDAVQVAPGTTTQVFCNQMIASMNNAVEFAKAGKNEGLTGDDGPTQEMYDQCCRFADGSSIPLEIMKVAKDICEEVAVNIEWQKGDVALLDNYLVMHARRMWSGEAHTRRVLASLVK